MTKHVAGVTQLLRPGMHRMLVVHRFAIRMRALPPPNRVEIEREGGRQDCCMVFRYTDDGEFRGDTWQADLEDAFEQARLEQGLTEDAFARVEG